jgi:putative nucleotidyltransferase with HDIG domain
MENKKERILQLVRDFEGFPAAASQVIALANDPTASVDRMEKAIQFDQTMTANVLRLANSSYYGRASKVGSLRDAVLLVGFGKLAEMMVAAYLKSLSQRPLKGYDLPAGGLLRHGLTVAVVADEIGRLLGKAAGGNHFTAALLHDIGKLVLGQFVGDEMAQIEAAAAQGVPFETAESQILGVNHAEVGGLILEKWTLPEDIVQAVRWHHDPEHAPSGHAIVDIVHMANSLGMMIGIGTGREGLQFIPSMGSATRLGLEMRHFEWVASEALQKIESLTQAIETSDRG